MESNKPLKADGKIAHGETASELAHRHMEDETHETTEEEIRNVTLELGDEPVITDEYEKEVERTAEEVERKNDDDDDDEKDIIVTPASILGG